MKFRKNTSFNSNDSNLVVTDKRYVITHDLPRRCELVLNRLIKAGSTGLTANQMLVQMNKALKIKSYSLSDITYALKRLVSVNVISVHSFKNADTKWKARASSILAWRKLPKTVV